MRDFWATQRKKIFLQQAEDEGRVSDSLTVRLELMRQVESGEKTLEEVQSELKRIKRDAKKNGKVTRSQAYNGN